MKIKKHEAEQQVQDERWQCLTCAEPHCEEYMPYCLSCGMYWKDVQNGLFEKEDY